MVVSFENYVEFKDTYPDTQRFLVLPEVLPVSCRIFSLAPCEIRPEEKLTMLPARTYRRDNICRITRGCDRYYTSSSRTSGPGKCSAPLILPVFFMRDARQRSCSFLPRKLCGEICYPLNLNGVAKRYELIKHNSKMEFCGGLWT